MDASNQALQSTMHILLIEDNPADARLVRFTLENSSFADFDVHHEETLEAGLQWLIDHQVAAVLLDLSLPDSDGFETLRSLLERHPDTNTIVMTGHSDKAMGLQAVKTGAQDYLIKGEYDSEQLLRALRYSIERKQNTELKKAHDVSVKAEVMKERLLAGVSHEMRTPMNAILGMSNLLLQTTLDAEQQEYVSSIKQSSELLLGLINDILDISALKNKSIQFEQKTFDLPRLLKNLIEVMKFKAQEKSLAFNLEIDDNAPKWVKGDALRLNQILFNLVGNAIKFTERGSISVRIRTLSHTTEKALLKFQVTDSGIGIAPEEQDVIFEAFTRITQKDRIQEGTGLGLSIAKNLVDQQGGIIGVDSEIGKGSTFYFTLPVIPTTPLRDIKGDRSEIGTIIETNTYKILLVEDHKMNQLVAKKTIENRWHNIDVVVAENGREAINILKKESIDLILMDIQMPIMDGYEATNHIRNHMDEPIRNIPILAMTAHVNVEQDEKYQQSGMNGIVFKPFHPKQLFKAIGKHLNYPTS